MSLHDNLRICHACENSCKAPRSGPCECQLSGRDIVELAESHRCPLHLFPSRGIGDTIANVLDKTRIGPVAKLAIEKVTGKPCGCDKRQEALNQLIPFKE